MSSKVPTYEPDSGLHFDATLQNTAVLEVISGASTSRNSFSLENVFCDSVSPEWS
jgi:hypothetical protein